MVASIARASLARSAVRASTRAITTSAARRANPAYGSMLHKDEMWTQKDIDEANELPAGTIVLKDIIPSIEARWIHMSRVEQYAVYKQLEEIQRKDWTELTLDEKKAAWYVAFGPHGPRRPIVPPGQALRTFTGTVLVAGLSVAVFYGVRSQAPPPPKTMTKEYQEQMNKRALEEKLNPITGISSEGYKGRGFVQ